MYEGGAGAGWCAALLPWAGVGPGPSPSNTVMARIDPDDGPVTPFATDDQVEPSHRAMLFTNIPFTRSNRPPAYRVGGFGPGPSSSKKASAKTPPYSPNPLNAPSIGVHRRPSHLATPNLPPAYRTGGFGPGPSSSCIKKV